MRLPVKSRKKYHGSIMKCYRSIIKDCTMHEKRLLKQREKTIKTSQKDCLNIAKRQKNIAQKRVRYLGTRCPRFGQWLPSTRSADAHVMGCGCPCNGHKQTNRRA